jgi:hypothetical protein
MLGNGDGARAREEAPAGVGDERSARLRDALSRAREAVRPLVLPAVLALPPFAWVCEATRRASLETLGRDQGIFQYIAMAVLRGARDYRDVRDVNGPLTHLVHMVFLLLGGADEHRFRVLDLSVTGASFAAVGACLPGLSRAKGDAPPGALERVAWAFAAWVILSAQYLRYLFWDLAQRESFFDWFMLVSVGLEVAALSPLTAPRARRWTLALSGALSILPWFGKPTFALFTIAQVLTLLVTPAIESQGEREESAERRGWLKTFVAGGGAGALAMVAFLLVYADIFAFARIYLLDVPRLYRFIWPRTALDSLGLPGVSSIAVLAIVSSLAMLGLIMDGQFPRRLLAVALVPLAGVASVIAQAKGFPYHFHPVSAGLYLQGLVLIVWLSEQLGGGRETSQAVARPVDRLLRIVPFGASAALSLAVVSALLISPHLENWWILQKGITPELRRSHDYLVYFRTADFFPWEMRQTAEYLQEHTKPDDRVQVYGMDPYLLFLADRLSATPYIYAYDLDVDTALVGSSLPAPEGLHPTWAEAEVIRRIRDEHERDFFARIKAAPPAAFVFLDHSPLISDDDDAWRDFASHNAMSAAWVAEHYVQTAAFGDDCVWMRKELSEGLPVVTRDHTPKE